MKFSGEKLLDPLREGCRRLFGSPRLAKVTPDSSNRERRSVYGERRSSNEDRRRLERTEEALRESNRLYQALAEVGFEGIMFHDQGRILEVNRSYAEMFGYPPAAMIGMDAFDRIAPEDRETLRRCAALGETRSYEVLALRSDSTTFPMETRGQFTAYRGKQVRVVCCRDITERRLAEEALRQSVEQYRLLAENVHDVIWTMDLKGNFTFVSPSVFEVHGFTREELMAGGLTLLMTAENAQLLADELKNSISARTSANGSLDGSRVMEMKLRHKDGSFVEVEIVVSFLRDSSARRISVLGVSRDITERKRLEEQFQQAQKMEAVGLLAGGVAHDFNNLLQAILGYGELALDSRKVDSIHNFLEQVMKAGDRGKTLVHQLLAFSSKQVLDLSDLNLNEVVDDLVKLIGRVIGEHIAVEVTPGADLRSIHADKGQIQQILMNLCINARDAMGEGGTITLETDNVDLDRTFCDANGGGDPGRYVMLRVGDTGCGIDPKIQQRMFDPFFTTKDLGEGTGLGLSTVFGIVSQHMGLVSVESEVGRGATFSIYFPASEPDPLSVEESTAQVYHKGSETILLADDDEGVRDVARMMLCSAGYAVICATDGKDAIRLFDEHADEIDLVLLDVVMPEAGGKAVAEHIKKVLPQMPVIFSSGYSGGAIHSAFAVDEGVPLIPKPYRREDLLRKVREVFELASTG